MTSAYLWLRLVKWLAVMTFASGTVGALFAHDLRERRRFAYLMAGPGLGLTWLAGFALVGWRKIPVLSLWIVGALLLSLVSINVVLFSVGRPGRSSAGTTCLALLTLFGCFFLMVMRPT